MKSVQIRSFFWSVFSHIRTEYKKMRSISPYLVRMRKNTDQKKLRIWTLFTQCYFQKLNIKDLTDDKKFWKIIKPFFSNKGLNSNKLMLREKDVLIADEKAIAPLMNKCFVNIIADLDLKRDSETLSDTSTSVSSIFERFHCHQIL